MEMLKERIYSSKCCVDLNPWDQKSELFPLLFRSKIEDLKATCCVEHNPWDQKLIWFPPLIKSRLLVQYQK
jgi:hypothetical protein